MIFLIRSIKESHLQGPVRWVISLQELFWNLDSEEVLNLSAWSELDPCHLLHHGVSTTCQLFMPKS